MAVYIDALKDTRGAWRYGKACHLVADSHDELMAFAERLGMKAAWLQKTPIEHFDLTTSRRALAVTLGAKQITWREMAMMVRKLRAVV